MSSRWPTLTDELLRDALTEEPRAGVAEAVLADLAAAVEHESQVGPIRIRWPWSTSMPGIGTSTARRRLTSTTLVALVALLLAVALTIGALVGALQRPRPLLGRPGVIAFDSGGQIFVANPDGTNRRQLIVDSGSAIEPTFSPDGTRLALMSLDTTTTSVRVVVIDPDGSRRAVAGTSKPVGRASGPAIGWYRISWSPDARQLAYTAPVKGAQQIYVADANGGGARQIGDPTFEGDDPAWSPDGRRIAFLGGHFDSDRGVFVMAVDGSNVEKIHIGDGLETAFNFSYPVWSPTGGRLAFSAIVGSTRRIIVVDLDGGSTTVPSAGGVMDEWGPAWSPDGTRIAWHVGPQSSVEGRFAIGSPDGGPVSLLAPGVVGAPTWSPDGASLVGYRADPVTGARDRLVLMTLATQTAIEFRADAPGDVSWQWVAP